MYLCLIILSCTGKGFSKTRLFMKFYTFRKKCIPIYHNLIQILLNVATTTCLLVYYYYYYTRCVIFIYSIYYFYLTHVSEKICQWTDGISYRYSNYRRWRLPFPIDIFYYVRHIRKVHRYTLKGGYDRCWKLEWV